MRVTLLLFGLLGLSACSTSQGRHDEKEENYKLKLDPLIGKGTREQLVDMYGIPTKKETILGNDYWGWEIRNDIIRNAMCIRWSIKAYDDLSVGFDEKGIMRSWRVSIPK